MEPVQAPIHDFENKRPGVASTCKVVISRVIWYRPDFWSLNISSKYILHVLPLILKNTIIYLG